jgi:hypothetical protein
MEPPPSAWMIVIVRAWCDHGRLVVRLLMTHPGTDGKSTQTVVGSVEEACETLRQQLRTVADGGTG